MNFHKSIVVAIMFALLSMYPGARIVTGDVYTSVDSTETGSVACPEYNWIDADEGNDIFGSYYYDDATRYVGNRFDIKFFDDDFLIHKPFYACINGWVSFSSESVKFENTELPNNDEPTGSICLFWDDLVYRQHKPHSRIYSYVIGEKPIRIWVLSFENMHAQIEYIDAGSFQIQIRERNDGFNNTIEFHYKDVIYPAYTETSNGMSATIGLQNDASDKAVMYSFNEAVIENEFAIRFIDSNLLGIRHESLGKIKASFQ